MLGAKEATIVLQTLRSATEYARLCLFLSTYQGISKASFQFEPIPSVFMHKTTQGPVLDPTV